MIYTDYSLKTLNTLGFDVKAKQYLPISSIANLEKHFVSTEDYLVLGGGSNILFKGDYNGTIIHPLFQGIEIYQEDSNNVVLKVGAGVIWDNFVEYTVDKLLAGVENLSFIPGRVGASPVQNIGAYGVEAKDTILKVDGVFIDGLKQFSLVNKECNFHYRDSIFKNELKNKIIITHVYFKLDKKPNYILNYGNVSEELKKYTEVNLKTIRQAVISIRKNKLPDPEQIGNAGSFFKNPIVSFNKFAELKGKFPNIPNYSVKDSSDIKIPAGWMIDQCGLKGYRIGNVGVYDKQALVLVNYGGANPQEIIDLAQFVIDNVYKKFGIRIEPEVNYI